MSKLWRWCMFEMEANSVAQSSRCTFSMHKSLRSGKHFNRSTDFLIASMVLRVCSCTK
uniref:Uncharacterized protein n=1 Tax=Arundo donax TaxID=35708 RepID=A0A0A9A0S9_ARUDO